VILAHFKLVFGVRFEILMVMTIQRVRFWDELIAQTFWVLLWIAHYPGKHTLTS